LPVDEQVITPSTGTVFRFQFDVVKCVCVIKPVSSLTPCHRHPHLPPPALTCRKNAFVGVVHVQNKIRGCFTRENMELLQSLASQLGEALNSNVMCALVAALRFGFFFQFLGGFAGITA
jgi:hypothetical protein